MNLVSPSILAADFANLQAEAERASEAPWLHIDVMDGHFVPNISVGLPVVSSLRKATTQFLDVHLMIANPLAYARRFAEAGADLVCFHVEACESSAAVSAVLDELDACGVKKAMSLKPGTPAESLAPWLDRLDMALVMTVEPGFGGQAFMPDMLGKIRELHGMARERRAPKKLPPLLLEVDGGINLETAELCCAAGANVLVAGSYVFGSSDPGATIRALARVGCSA